RVAGDTARFATAFARVGYAGDFGGSWFLTQLVGTGKARELYFTTDIVDAREARELGMVNRVVPDARLEEETLALAARLARGPRIAYRYMKRNFNAAESGTLKDLLDLEAWHHTRCGLTEDHREATKAFVEKRDPVFRGLLPPAGGRHGVRAGALAVDRAVLRGHPAPPLRAVAHRRLASTG